MDKYLLAIALLAQWILIIILLITIANQKRRAEQLAEGQLEINNAFSSRVLRAFEEGHRGALDEARLLMKKHEKDWRAESVAKSKAVTLGKIAEQFAPFLPGWKYNPKDAKFLGSPVDFIIFNGMEEGAITEVLLLEIKTGKSRLSARERDLQDIAAFQRIRYEVLRV